MLVGTSRHFVIASALVAGAFLAPLGTAKADYTLTLHEAGFSDQTITYVGPPSSGQPQLINWGGTFGDFGIVVETSVSNSNLPGQLPTLTISNLQLTGTSGATLQITVKDTGFNPQFVGTGTVDVYSQVATTEAPSGSTVTYQSLLNGTGGDVLTLNAVSGAHTVNTLGPTGGTFTLENITTVTVGTVASGQSGIVQTSGITQVLAPEPATVVGAFSMLPFVGIGLWWRRRPKA